MAAISMASCSDDAKELPDVPSNNGGNSQATNLTAKDTASVALDKDPDFFVPNTKYFDDYRSYAGWAQKDKWNLANTHDPSVVYYKGMYYMFGTDASFGNEHDKCPSGKHFQGKRSYNLVEWEHVPGVMDKAPQWCLDSLNAIRGRMGLSSNLKHADISWGYWAPVVRKVTVDGQERIRMYYSIVVDNYIKSGKKASEEFDGSWGERAFIGMCETTNPNGGPSAWVDKGFVTCSSSDRGTDYSRKSTSNWDAYFYFNAIDPTYIVTESGEHYLIHGSWHSGFALLKVDGNTGKPFQGEDGLGEPYAASAEALQARYGKRISTRGISRWQASEGPEIVYKDGYYYLFMAWDGLDVPYNTRVVRAKDIEGPYYTSRGANFSAGAENTKVYPIVTHPYKFKNSLGWVGISHCAIFQNEDTKEWMYMSQGRFPSDGGNANAIMMGHVRKLVWCPSSAEDLSDLWPISLPERYARVEADSKYKAAIAKSEIAGEYEIINLGYDYGKQCEASATNLKLHADGSMSGYVSGTWSYDPDTKYLTLTSADGVFPGSANKVGSMVVCVERELDWENGNVTLVFAGFHKLMTSTYWGKKVANLQ